MRIRKGSIVGFELYLYFRIQQRSYQQCRKNPAVRLGAEASTFAELETGGRSVLEEKASEMPPAASTSPNVESQTFSSSLGPE